MTTMLRARSTAAAAIAVAFAWTGCFVDLGELQSGSSSSGMTSAAGGGGGASATGGGGTVAVTSSTGTGGTSSSGGGGQAFNPPWWDTKYKRRYPIDVHDTGGAGLPAGLQVRWSGALSMLANNATTGGLRVARYDASNHSWSEKALVIDSTPIKANVWFALEDAVASGGDDTSYWFYAGAASPPPPHGTPADVFADLYADFSGGLGGFISQGSPQMSASGVTLASGDSVRSPVTFGPGHAVDFAATVTSDVGFGTAGWLGGGFQRSNDFDDSEPWLLWLSRVPSMVQSEAELDSVGESGVGSMIPLDNTQQLLGVERYADHAIFLRGDLAVDTLGPWPGGGDMDPLQIRFMNTDNTNQGIEVIAWARVRRCVDPAPSVSVGSQETLP